MAVGGAWEMVVDKAALEVSRYMSLATDLFSPDSATARRMLALMDRSTLRDVLVERNVNTLCGMIGCAKAPRGGSCQKMTAMQDDSNSDEEQEEAGAPDDEDGAEAFRMYAKYRERRGDAAGREMIVVGGIAVADRFCSTACAEQFGALQANVQGSLVYGRADVVHAISSLFPNLSLATLQRLAGAESTVVADISEKSTLQQQQQHQVSPSTSVPIDDATLQLRRMLGGIRAVGRVWSREMQKSTASGVFCVGKREMPMPLMVYDWLFTVSTPVTRSIFSKLCHNNNNSHSSNGNLYIQCMQPILVSCLQRATLQQAQVQEEGEEEPSSVDLVQQERQRLSLLTAHLFSHDITETLSRLLLFDQATLERAWLVWQTSGLLISLQFPFALPGAFAASGVTAGMLFLALVMAAAMGLCVPEVWAEWLQEDNALAEVLDALGVTTAEFITCVRTLVLE